MPCVHTNLDHDTTAEIFLAGFVGTRHELLDLPKVAFWLLLALGISLQVCGSPAIGVASTAAVAWYHSSTLLNAIRVTWMLGLCVLEAWCGGCLLLALGGRSLPCYDPEIRWPWEPKVPLVRPRPIQVAV